VPGAFRQKFVTAISFGIGGDQSGAKNGPVFFLSGPESVGEELDISSVGWRRKPKQTLPSILLED
jgi:hypothetical protein